MPHHKVVPGRGGCIQEEALCLLRQQVDFLEHLLCGVTTSLTPLPSARSVPGLSP